MDFATLAIIVFLLLTVIIICLIVSLLFSTNQASSRSKRRSMSYPISHAPQQGSSTRRDFSRASSKDTPTHARKSAKSSVRLARENPGDWIGGYLKAKVRYVSSHFEVKRSDGYLMYGQSATQAAELLAREWLREFSHLSGSERERAINMLEIEASMDLSIE